MVNYCYPDVCLTSCHPCISQWATPVKKVWTRPIGTFCFKKKMLIYVYAQHTHFHTQTRDTFRFLARKSKRPFYCKHIFNTKTEQKLFIILVLLLHNRLLVTPLRVLIITLRVAQHQKVADSSPAPPRVQTPSERQ